MPYLPAVGAPSLRFRAGPPPPDLSARPTAGAPPLPALSRTESSVALANVAAAQLAGAHGPTDSHPGENNNSSPAAKHPPLPILPDEIRPQVRPEDFLPFFQVPGSVTQPNGVNSRGPAALPPSTATYSQTP